MLFILLPPPYHVASVYDRLLGKFRNNWTIGWFVAVRLFHLLDHIVTFADFQTPSI